MSTDPVADFLTRIRNAAQANHDSLSISYSSLRHALAKILQSEKYIASVEVIEAEGRKSLEIQLAYSKVAGQNRESAIRKLNRVSKPGRRMYVNHKNIPHPLRGLGTVILSTSGGLLTGRQARKLGLGGEVICEIW